MLDAEARKELRSLTRESADLVARHLVVVGRLLDDEPARALAHAQAARAMAGRVGVVREAAGLAAYGAGEWAEALSELRTARRITGRPEHLGVMADCERALGRPERALAYADDPDVPHLPQDQRVELVIVLAGARRDLGQADFAVLSLQDPARRTTAGRPWAARLWYAYADALLAAGRVEEARTWFTRVVDADADGQTDAGDRLLEIDGVVLDDLEEAEPPDEVDRQELLGEDELAAYVAQAFPRPVTADASPGPTSLAPPSTDAAQYATPPAPDTHASTEATDAPGSTVAGPGAVAHVPAPGFVSGTAASTSEPETTAAPGPNEPEPVRARSLMPQFASPPPLPDPDGDDE